MARKNPAAVELGRRGGRSRWSNATEDERKAVGERIASVGGQARAAKLTAKQRSAIARKAAAARWGRKPSK